MFNKNDPLIGAVQEVIKKNQSEREAARLVNEKFGVHDRKALPHEKQGAWDAAYKQILSESNSLAALAPPHDKVTHKDVLVGRGVLKKQGDKHVLAKEDMGYVSSPETMARKAAAKQKVRMGGNPTGQPNSDRPASVYRKAAAKQKVRMGGNPTGQPMSSSSMEEDVTSPSSMGIKKPDYATSTPDYANKGPQMVNRAAKTSAPAGTVKEENLEEKAVSKAQHRFFGLVRGIQKGEAHGSAKAKKAAKSMSAKSVKDYAKTSEKGLPEKVSEQTDVPQGDILSLRARKGQTQYGRNPSPTARPTPAANNPNSSTGVYAAQQGAADRAKLDSMAASRRAASAGGARPSPNIGGNTGNAARPAAGIGPGNKPAPAAIAKSTPTPNAAAANASKMLAAKGQQARMGGNPTGQASSQPAARPAPAVRPNDTGRAGVPGTGNRLAKPAATQTARPAAAPAATQTARPAGGTKRPVTPVRKASTSGGLRTQKDANLLARAKAGGGQRLSTTFKSGGDRLNYLRARAQANK